MTSGPRVSFRAVDVWRTQAERHKSSFVNCTRIADVSSQQDIFNIPPSIDNSMNYKCIIALRIKQSPGCKNNLAVNRDIVP